MLRSALVALAVTLFSPGVFAQAFQEGVHYQRIQPAQPTDDPKQVEVVEVFGYLCPHCANFQPFIDSWVTEAPEHVEYRRIPVVFRPSWEPLARAYYAIEALGIVDEAHEAIFTALHKERMRLVSNEDIAEFIAERYDISESDYLRAANSFAIETKLRRGMSQVQRFGVNATPSIVINGKYRATAAMAGSNAKLIELIEHLVAQEYAAIAETASSN
ncbi:MAG: thiol:disulfide interchange protein DsbA/DsbL [Xanthomonadales bacterium]|nr:thiol:disulfide interchange protein DsbA/DsbL [Xanthomonadales bacterium]